MAVKTESTCRRGWVTTPNHLLLFAISLFLPRSGYSLGTILLLSSIIRPSPYNNLVELYMQHHKLKFVIIGWVKYVGILVKSMHWENEETRTNLYIVYKQLEFDVGHKNCIF